MSRALRDAPTAGDIELTLWRLIGDNQPYLENMVANSFREIGRTGLSLSLVEGLGRPS